MTNQGAIGNICIVLGCLLISLAAGIAFAYYSSTDEKKMDLFFVCGFFGLTLVVTGFIVL